MILIEIDTICFSEVLDNLNFDLVEGKIVYASLVLQTMNDTKSTLLLHYLILKKIESKKENLKF